MTRVAVGLSGSGTNFAALLAATRSGEVPAQISVVFSDRHRAVGLAIARDAGIPTEVVLRREHGDRSAYDAALVHRLRPHAVDWICLAGFMRLVTPTLLDAYPQRVLNIHPALLPAFPGLHAQRQAHAHGVRIAGCTVHLVDPGTDTGPIVLQGAVPALADDTEASLSARILRMEHRVYPTALRWAVQGKLRVHERTVVVRDESTTCLFDPSVT